MIDRAREWIAAGEKEKDSVFRDEMHFVSEEKALILIKLPSAFFFYSYRIIVEAFVLFSYIMGEKKKMR